MSNPEWSKGPWVAHVPGPDDPWQAYVEGPEIGFAGDYRKSADAHLISAAPDLYESVLALLWANTNEDIKEAAILSDAALRKARGLA